MASSTREQRPQSAGLKKQSPHPPLFETQGVRIFRTTYRSTDQSVVEARQQVGVQTENRWYLAQSKDGNAKSQPAKDGADPAMTGIVPIAGAKLAQLNAGGAQSDIFRMSEFTVSSAVAAPVAAPAAAPVAAPAPAPAQAAAAPAPAPAKSAAAPAPAKSAAAPAPRQDGAIGISPSQSPQVGVLCDEASGQYTARGIVLQRGSRSFNGSYWYPRSAYQLGAEVRSQAPHEPLNIGRAPQVGWTLTVTGDNTRTLWFWHQFALASYSQKVERPKPPEPPKPEPAKPAPAKDAKPEPAKTAKPEPAKPEPAKPAKPEPAKPVAAPPPPWTIFEPQGWVTSNNKTRGDIAARTQDVQAVSDQIKGRRAGYEAELRKSGAPAAEVEKKLAEFDATLKQLDYYSPAIVATSVTEGNFEAWADNSKDSYASVGVLQWAVVRNDKKMSGSLATLFADLRQGGKAAVDKESRHELLTPVEQIYKEAWLQFTSLGFNYDPAARNVTLKRSAYDLFKSKPDPRFGANKANRPAFRNHQGLLQEIAASEKPPAPPPAAKAATAAPATQAPATQAPAPAPAAPAPAAKVVAPPSPASAVTAAQPAPAAAAKPAAAAPAKAAAAPPKEDPVVLTGNEVERFLFVPFGQGSLKEFQLVYAVQNTLLGYDNKSVSADTDNAVAQNSKIPIWSYLGGQIFGKGFNESYGKSARIPLPGGTITIKPETKGLTPLKLVDIQLKERDADKKEVVHPLTRSPRMLGHILTYKANRPSFPPIGIWGAVHGMKGRSPESLKKTVLQAELAIDAFLQAVTQSRAPELQEKYAADTKEWEAQVKKVNEQNAQSKKKTALPQKPAAPSPAPFGTWDAKTKTAAYSEEQFQQALTYANGKIAADAVGQKSLQQAAAAATAGLNAIYGVVWPQLRGGEVYELEQFIIQYQRYILLMYGPGDADAGYRVGRGRLVDLVFEQK